MQSLVHISELSSTVIKLRFAYMTIIASEDRPAFVKRGDHRRGVVCLAGDDRRQVYFIFSSYSMVETAIANQLIILTIGFK